MMQVTRNLVRLTQTQFSLARLVVICLFVSACSITPESIVKQPTTATAKPVATNNSNGAIFNSASYRPMFEDRRPRFVGDIVTINIAENTNAKKSGGNSGSKDSRLDSAITSFMGRAIPKASFSSSASGSYEDKIDADASNTFNGSVTATVIEVLPNGNLVVSGEKQVSFDKSTEFVRFSGVINPDTISIGNTVSSNRVADARVEYRSNSKVDAAEVASMFARFFLSMAAL